MATGYFSDLNSLHSGLSLQVSVKLLLDIRQDWSPASPEGFTGFVRYNAMGGWGAWKAPVPLYIPTDISSVHGEYGWGDFPHRIAQN